MLNYNQLKKEQIQRRIWDNEMSQIRFFVHGKFFEMSVKGSLVFWHRGLVPGTKETGSCEVTEQLHKTNQGLDNKKKGERQPVPKRLWKKVNIMADKKQVIADLDKVIGLIKRDTKEISPEEKKEMVADTIKVS